MFIELSKTKIYTILISLFYVFGLVGVYYNFEIPVAVILTSIIVFLILKFQLNTKKSVMLFLIFVLGTIRAQNSLNLDTTIKDITSDRACLKGQIVSSKDISYKNKKVKFYINVKEADFLDGTKENRDFQDLNSKVLVSANFNGSIENNVKIGDHIEIKGKYITPNPATNPHQFNYKKYLLNNNCLNILYADSKSFKVIKSPEFSFKNPSDSWYFILKEFEKARNNIIEKHSKIIKSPRLEVLGGIVFGDETINPDEKIKENFKNSGLLHLLAASGLNVALIYGIWWWIAGLIRFPYNLSILTGAVFVILYTFMTGFPPSILRAGIMLLFVLFGKLIDRKASSSALIFFAGFIILLFNPKMLFDIGFQLSFAVTFGLIVCCPVILSKFENIDKKYKEKHKDKNCVKKYLLYMVSPINTISVFLVPLVAQLWVIPLQMHYFNNLAPLSILANIAVVPFIGILSFIGFVGSIFALVPYLDNIFVFIFDIVANQLLRLLIKISEIFASFKISLITTIGLDISQIFLFWLIILLITLNINSNFKFKKEKLSLVVAVIIFLLSFCKINYLFGHAEIMMFDTTSNSFLIKSPNNRYVLFDIAQKTRGYSKVENILNKYLQNERIKKLKFVVLPDKNEDISDLSSIVKIENLKDLTNTKNGEKILSEKDFEIELFSDNNSLFSLVKYKNNSIFLMNSYSFENFRKIEKYLPEKVNILKIPYNKQNIIDDYLIKRLKPDYVLISEYSSKTTDPALVKVINLLYQNDVKIIKSKDYGFVKISAKENKFDFYNYDKNSNKLIKIKFYDKVDFSKSSYIKEFIERNQ